MNEPLPVNREEMARRGWDRIDILLVTGDAYVDHPSFGAALIGRLLEAEGYRVGVLAQPDWTDPQAFTVMGRPVLFAGVTSGNMDSMVNHYTSLARLRSDDAYTPGGLPGRRPDRALLKYTNCLQRSMKGLPIILGGIEASLRRVSHYDFWSDSLKKSVLLDSKASLLVYGMGERQIVEIARRVAEGRSLSGIRGTVIALHSSKYRDASGDARLPSHEEILEEPARLIELTGILEANQNPWSGSRLIQNADSRTVIVEPPALPLETEEFDRLYELPYTRQPHPSCRGHVPAHTMIRDSITVVRGCGGGCSFCAIGLHQGKSIVSRSPESVLREIGEVVSSPGFRGTITDLGGPTANLYGLGCSSRENAALCNRPSCFYPNICPNFRTDHGRYMELLDGAETISGVSSVFISSGIRHDVALKDPGFVERLARKNVSGHLRIAPEHTTRRVLDLMRKPGREQWENFKTLFDASSGKTASRKFIVPYIMAAFPGCTLGDMLAARDFISKMGPLPRQVQIFLPTPLTPASAMYFTGLSYPEGKPLRIPVKPSDKSRQKEAVLGGGGEDDTGRNKNVNHRIQHRKAPEGESEGRDGKENPEEAHSGKKSKKRP